MDEAQAAAFVEHFQAEVLGRLPKGPAGKTGVPVIAIPYLTPDELADPTGRGAKYRIPLVNQVTVLADPEPARRRTVSNGAAYLTTASDGLLDAARKDLAALDDWKTLVQTCRNEFDRRYRKEFLTGESFRRFDDAKARLLALLELPGPGKALGTLLWALSLPFRLVKGAVGKAFVRPDAPNLKEDDVLLDGRRGWLDRLRAESIRRADGHPLFKHVSHGFSAGLGEAAEQKFDADFRNFQLGSADEIEAAAIAVTAPLETNPQLLATARAAKLVFDAAAVGLGLWAGGFGWTSLIFVPLFASVTHQGLDLIALRRGGGEADEGARPQVGAGVGVAERAAGGVADELADHGRVGLREVAGGAAAGAGDDQASGRPRDGEAGSTTGVAGGRHGA